MKWTDMLAIIVLLALIGWLGYWVIQCTLVAHSMNLGAN